MPSQRGKTICFVDNSNVFNGPWRVDWEKFQSHLEQGGDVWQTYFFAAEQDPPRAIQSSFYRFLKAQLHWEVVLTELGQKTVTCHSCQHKETVHAEKGVDVGLATKMLMLAFNKAYDTAILVSGDRDYLETVKFIKNMGLRIEIMAWQGTISTEFAMESSTQVVYLDSLSAQIGKT